MRASSPFAPATARFLTLLGQPAQQEVRAPLPSQLPAAASRSGQWIRHASYQCAFQSVSDPLSYRWRCRSVSSHHGCISGYGLYRLSSLFPQACPAARTVQSLHSPTMRRRESRVFPLLRSLWRRSQTLNNDGLLSVWFNDEDCPAYVRDAYFLNR